MIVGLILGALGAAWHLLVLRWRVRQITAGRAVRAWVAMPLGITGPAIGALLAVRLAGGAGAVGFLVASVAVTALALRRA